jgi:hypothetical protein
MRGKIILTVGLLLISVSFADAAAVTAQGKKVATLVDQTASPIPILGLSYSAPLPTKYKSKKNFLLVTVSAQATCSGDFIAGSVVVDGQALLPSPGAYIMCSSDDQPVFRVAQWVLAPESLGGPAITPGSTVSVTFNSGGSASTITVGGVTIRVDMQQ